MEAQKVDMFIMSNAKFFESHHLSIIRERLLQIDESRWAQIQVMQFKDPTTSIIISLLAGTFGIDRFFIGDTGLGIGKLVTCGGGGIWAMVDWFLIMPATRQKNFENFQQFIY